MKSIKIALCAMALISIFCMSSTKAASTPLEECSEARVFKILDHNTENRHLQIEVKNNTEFACVLDMIFDRNYGVSTIDSVTINFAIFDDWIETPLPGATEQTISRFEVNRNGLTTTINRGWWSNHPQKSLNSYRLFHVTDGTLIIKNSLIEHMGFCNYHLNVDEEGGAISVSDSGKLILDKTTINECCSISGGGALSVSGKSANAELISSLLQNNGARQSNLGENKFRYDETKVGGSIVVRNGATLTLRNLVDREGLLTPGISQDEHAIALYDDSKVNYYPQRFKQYMKFNDASVGIELSSFNPESTPSEPTSNNDNTNTGTDQPIPTSTDNPTIVNPSPIPENPTGNLGGTNTTDLNAASGCSLQAGGAQNTQGNIIIIACMIISLMTLAYKRTKFSS